MTVPDDASTPRFAVRRVRVGAALLALAVSAASCVHPREAVRLDSPDTNARIAAIKRAAKMADRKAAPQLVVALDDEDPAVRFYAIEALARLAGDRMGYDYFDEDPEARKPAVDRWREWVSKQGVTMPKDSHPVSTTRP